MIENIMTDNSIPNAVFLRQAVATDIPELETLLNRCYRFEEGWTNETEIIGGIRTNQDELKSVIDDAKQYLFVYPQTDTGDREGQETGEILGCINVAIEDEDDSQEDCAYIGLFAVNPKLQGGGVGRVMLAAAESFVQSCLPDHQVSADGESNDKLIKMLVLNGRDKMLAYYERRGYINTGNTQAFSADDNSVEAKDKELYFIEIAKVIN